MVLEYYANCGRQHPKYNQTPEKYDISASIKRSEHPHLQNEEFSAASFNEELYEKATPR